MLFADFGDSRETGESGRPVDRAWIQEATEQKQIDTRKITQTTQIAFSYG
jgi:hypothetical protein